MSNEIHDWTTPRIHILNVGMDTASEFGSGQDGLGSTTTTPLPPAPLPF